MTPNKLSDLSSFEISSGIDMVKSSTEHAEELFRAIDENREYLNRFLPWVKHTKILSDTVSYLWQSTENYIQGIELTYNIFRNSTIIGRIGIHQIDKVNHNASIGYWLVQDEQGQGIISKACYCLLKIAFEDLGFQRMEILTATNNAKSTAIPQRLGFTHEGVLRQMEKHENIYFDLNIFSLLRQEWYDRTIK